MIERKCLKCGTWNGDEQFCKSCGAAIAPDVIIREEELVKRKEAAAVPKDKLDILIGKARGSKYLLVRWMFYSAYSVVVVVTAIASFFAYLIVWAAA